VYVIGNYGQVFKGRYRSNIGGEQDVAIKIGEFRYIGLYLLFCFLYRSTNFVCLYVFHITTPFLHNILCNKKSISRSKIIEN